MTAHGHRVSLGVMETSFGSTQNEKTQPESEPLWEVRLQGMIFFFLSKLLVVSCIFSYK